MASALAWPDIDDTEQQKRRQLMALFKDESTVYAVGPGTIGDTIANALFSPEPASCRCELPIFS